MCVCDTELHLFLVVCIGACANGFCSINYVTPGFSRTPYPEDYMYFSFVQCQSEWCVTVLFWRKPLNPVFNLFEKVFRITLTQYSQQFCHDGHVLNIVLYVNLSRMKLASTCYYLTCVNEKWACAPLCVYVCVFLCVWRGQRQSNNDEVTLNAYLWMGVPLHKCIFFTEYCNRDSRIDF